MTYRENTAKVDRRNEVERNHSIISDFRNYWCILKRRWPSAIAVFGSVFALSAVYAFTKTPIYRVQGQLLFKPEDRASFLMGLDSAAQQGSPQDSGWLEADRILDTQIRVILSDSLLQKTLDVLKRDNVKGLPSNQQEFQAGLAIKKVTNTNVITIAYQSTSPRVAALVVNQLMATYINNNLLETRGTAIAAREFITEQLPKVKEKVVRDDTALSSFKEKNGITDLDATQSALMKNLERIQSQIDLAETQLAGLNSQSVAIQKKLEINPQEAIAASALSQYPAMHGLLANLQDVQRKLADAQARYQEFNPVLIGLQAREAQAKALLQEQVAQILDGQKKQMTILANQKAFYLKQATILPRLVQQQRELERERLAAESTYETLLKSLQQVSIQENQTVGSVRIIESALVPKTPFAPNKASIMIAGSLSGILLAGAILYLLEARDKKIRTVKEAREIFEYTMIGTIPVFSKTKRTVASNNRTSDQRLVQLPVIEKPRSYISESYRRIQANLKFLVSDNTLKVIVVTSSVPKEGKSTVCANLAASMAQLGHRVLIVDADLHRPSQHQFWDLSNEEGLSNIIAEQVNLKRNVFHKVMENLDVITSGVLPPNPLALIHSRRMATFLEECSKNYNYVLVDTPPLAFAADAVTLGRIADGVVIVTRPGVADATSSTLAKEYLEQSVQNVLGIVINGVLPENEPHSSLHYYAQG